MRNKSVYILLILGILFIFIIGTDFFREQENAILPNKEVTHKKFTVDDNLSKSVETIDEIILQSLQKTHKKMLEALKETRICFKKAKAKIEAFECSQKIRMINTEHFHAFSDIDEEPFEIDMDSFVWNYEKKENILREILNSVMQLRSEEACISSLASTNEIGECFDLKEGIENYNIKGKI